jgi:hypothetical protein
MSKAPSQELLDKLFPAKTPKTAGKTELAAG